MDDPILIWNEISLEANRVSHTDGSKEQNGPTLSSRALAIVHLAMYDAYAGIDENANLKPYLKAEIEPPANTPQNLSIAVSAAAYTTLVELYPSQFDYFIAQLKLYAPDKFDPAFLYGEAVARQILQLRKDDPSASQGTFRPARKRGVHRVDPDNPTQGYHGPFYGERSKCFAVANRGGLRLNPPPFGDGKNPEYLSALRQVRAKGIKPELTATLPDKFEVAKRTPEETTVGIYWSYDGTPGLGTPPRLYNQIVRKIAVAKNNTWAQNAHLLALVNAAMGDAGILCWEEKYIHQFWRPVLGIRDQDKSFGVRDEEQPAPSGDKLDVDADPFWLPMGSPSSNTANVGVSTAQGTFPFANVQIGKVKNFTPNFPAYPSGHATFGAAAFQMTRLFYGIEPGNRQHDQLLGNDFYFVSEEMNDKTQDNVGTVRPLHRRSFKDGIWQMIIENSLSRIFLGVHWSFDGFMLKGEQPDFESRIGGVWLGCGIAESIYRRGLKPPGAVDFQNTLYAPTIDLQKTTKIGQIVLNSRSPRPMEVTPTFYTEEGKAIVGEKLVLQPLEIRFISVKNLIPVDKAEKEDWGGMSLTYIGKSMEVAAQITLNGKDGGSADVLLAPIGKSGSDVQEAVWWQPEKGKAIIALGNISADTIKTTARFSDGTTEEFDIAPFATYYLEHKPKDNKKKGNNLSVKLTSSGLAGMLKVIGFVTSNKKDLNGSIRFYEPKNISQPDLFATNFEVKNSEPHLLLKNTSDTNITATAHFYSSQESSKQFDLKPVKLAPGEIKELDLKPLQKEAAKQKSLENVSVRIQNSGSSGSLIGSLFSTNNKSKIEYDIPLRDSGAVDHSTGAYPWRIDDDYTTVISITNAGNKKARLSTLINFNGGRYLFPFFYLEANQSVSYDLKKIRDEQIPDENGIVIPLSETIGQFKWSIIMESKDDIPLIGRSLIVNHDKKVSNSFSCPLCCPYQGPAFFDSLPYYYVSVGELKVNDPVSGFYLDCYGFPSIYPTYSIPGSVIFTSMYTGDPDIALIDMATSGYFIKTTGVSPGSVYWNGWYYRVYIESDEEGCYDMSYPAYDGNGIDVIPTVQKITASIPSTKNPVTNVAPAAVVYETTNTSTNFATESTSNLMTVFQNPDTAVTITAVGVDPSSSASQLKWKIERDPSDTVASGTPTLSGTTGGQITLTPTVAGNFRLICYYDSNNDDHPDSQEILRVLLFAIVRVKTASISAEINRDINFVGGPSSEPGEFGVAIAPFPTIPLSMLAEFIIEGGGANKRIGTNRLNFGNVGNLTAINAKVNYSSSGIATENPGGSLPMVDSFDDPSGGDSAFRNSNSTNIENDAGGGKKVTITSADNPGFGPYKIVHPNTSNTWATTEGGYDFKEFIVGYSLTFQKTYFVIADAVWTVRYVGSNSSGNWVNSSSDLTLQGASQNTAAFTTKVSSDSPQKGDTAGVQPLGLSFVNHKSPVYTP